MKTTVVELERNNTAGADNLPGRTVKPLFGGSNPPVASISTQTEEAPEKSGAFLVNDSDLDSHMLEVEVSQTGSW